MRSHSSHLLCAPIGGAFSCLFWHDMKLEGRKSVRIRACVSVVVWVCVWQGIPDYVSGLCAERCGRGIVMVVFGFAFFVCLQRRLARSRCPVSECIRLVECARFLSKLGNASLLRDCRIAYLHGECVLFVDSRCRTFCASRVRFVFAMFCLCQDTFLIDARVLHAWLS